MFSAASHQHEEEFPVGPLRLGLFLSLALQRAVARRPPVAGHRLGRRRRVPRRLRSSGRQQQRVQGCSTRAADHVEGRKSRGIRDRDGRLRQRRPKRWHHRRRARPGPSVPPVSRAAKPEVCFLELYISRPPGPSIRWILLSLVLLREHGLRPLQRGARPHVLAPASSCTRLCCRLGAATSGQSPYQARDLDGRLGATLR